MTILLHVDLAFNDKPKIVCKKIYDIKNTLMFAWFLIIKVGYYH